MLQFGQVFFIVGLLIAFLAGIGNDSIPVLFAGNVGDIDRFKHRVLFLF